MKSYIDDRQIRLVGKAWEIRHCLQRMAQTAGKDVKLIDYINRTPNPQPRKRPKKTQDLRIVPFPSK